MSFHRITYLISVLFIAVFISDDLAQESKRTPGAALNLQTGSKSQISSAGFITPIKTVAGFNTTVYTFGDITIFSYFNNTSVKIYNSSGTEVGSATLEADKMYTVQPGNGIYKVEGNKSYTVLIGDAISGSTNGYFAVDEAGRGVSTKLNTWMMKSRSSYDDFVIFAYNDNTGFTVKNLETGNLIFAGTLNKGEHYSFAEAENTDIPFSKPLQVTGTQPISALSYTDQDYYVPSSNGTFTGVEFYGYSAYNGSWTNSITVTSYADNNSITISNSVTGETINTYTAQKGQVFTESINGPTFWTVKSTYPVSAANIPFAGWSGNYYYMARSVDESGKAFGKLFYVPTIGSRIDVFSFESSNSVKITQLGEYDDFPYSNQTEIWSGTLGEGEGYDFFSPSGQYVYLIEGTGNLSVLQSNGGAGADFMPLAYSLDYADLAISSSDIQFSKPDSLLQPGDVIDITVNIHNYGNVAANNILFVAYEGDPDLGGSAPPVGNGTIFNIAPGQTGSRTFSYVVPTQPEYRSIVVKVDPNDVIVESNKSNNKAQRFLRPNNDLWPPLAVSVTAPTSLALENGQITPNPFKVRYDIFNTGTVAAENVLITLELSAGLTLSSGDLSVNIGQILASGSANVEFEINANPNYSGFNFYKATITSGNSPTKIVNRAINVPDAVPPSAPSNFKGTAGSNGSASFTWNANTESDLTGYYLYYSTDGVNWDAAGADQGSSPLLILSATSFSISGLPVPIASGTDYWFMLKAFDSSTNLSPPSDIVKLTFTTGGSEQVIFYGDSPFLYSVSDGTGYVTGPNNYGDVGKYQRFDINQQATLKEIRIYFGQQQINGSADNINVVVRSVGASGAPEDMLYSTVVSTNDIDISSPGVKYNEFIVNPQAAVNSSFFIGVEWPGSTDDEFAIIVDSSSQGEGAKRAWEKWSDGTYHDIHTAWSGLDVDLWIAAVILTTTGTEEEIGVPAEYQLSQNYPNPFNPSTTIKYSLPENGYVTLKVYDLLGKEKAVLYNGARSAGVYETEFKAASLPSGIYFYRLQIFDAKNLFSEKFSETKKLILLK